MIISPATITDVRRQLLGAKPPRPDPHRSTALDLWGLFVLSLPAAGAIPLSETFRRLVYNIACTCICVYYPVNCFV